MKPGKTKTMKLIKFNKYISNGFNSSENSIFRVAFNLIVDDLHNVLSTSEVKNKHWFFNKYIMHLMRMDRIYLKAIGIGT